MDAENKLAMGANNAAAAPEGANASAMAAAASEAMIAALQALTLVPDANGQVILPAGVELDDIRVSGRDLVISLPDGTQMIIPDGAVFVPQFVLDGIAVPPLNIAALLISQETAPAAGRPTSSGGNFADPVGDIGDPFARGDLLPPTELAFGQPEEKELIPGLVDEEPTTIIITPDQPAGSVSATDRVSEAGLPARGSESPGSNEAANSETTSGSIVFQTPDGFGSVTLNGTAITSIGQVISTPNGRLTITSIAPGNIGYSYTLTDNTSGDNTSDVFAVVVTDADGDAATANLTISIVDDVPTARNDTDTMAAGTYGPETGNVLTGVGTTSGSAGADTPGADSAVLTGIRAGSSGAFVAPGTALVGAYGTLTIGANGSYSYVRNPGTPGGVNDVFSYQITDGDGDASTATLTISIADAAPATAANAAVLLDDDALAGGNAGGEGDDANAANTSGTLAASGGDGPLTWALSTSGAPSGFTYVANGTGIDVLQGSTVVLRVTLNSATGAYTVTQLAQIQHVAGGDENNAVFMLGYQVTDRDGDAATGNLTINVDDDTPVATNDTDNIASGTYGPATGNVITDAEGDGGADSVGADGGAAVSAISGFGGAGAVGGATTGQYGVLTLNADGSYSYVRNAGTAGGVSDSFTYTLRDADGDTTTATLTITIQDASPEAGENATVLLDDDALTGGNPGGTGDDANAANTSGTLAASGGDGPLTWALATSGAPAGFTYVANGTGIDVLQGATVVLRVTLNAATGAYTVTQLAPIQHVAGSDENNQSFALTYTVTDQDGDTANSILAINVDDDTPLAANDSDSIAAGSYGPATGNVLTDAEGDGGADSRGADGGAVTAISGFGGAGAIGGTTNGQYGVLTLNADGSYSYARNVGTPGGVNDVFTYRLTDGDGDTVTATLTISIADSPTALDLPTEGEAGTLVDEAGLPAGSNAASNSETTAGTIAYTAPDGPAVVAIDGIAVTAVGQTFVGAFGTLTVTTIANGAIGYSYTLTTNTSGDNTFDDFAIVVTDQDGDATAGTLVVDIIDDVPTARPDVDSVTEDALVDGEGNPVADGNVITGVGGGDANATDGVADTRGADGATVTAIAFGATAGTVGGATNGAYGVLTLNADGSYSYVLNNADPRVQGLDGDDILTEVFTYTLTDGDGDVRTTTLTITINGADDPITIGGLNLRGPEVIVDEDDLSDGTSPNPAALTQTGTFTVNGTDGIAAILIEGGNIFVGQSFTTAYGTFTITTISAPVDGSATAITVGYSYVLTDNTAHPAGSGENFITEVFDIAVADTDGSTDSATIEVRIIDDVPAAVNDTDTIASGSYGPATGNVITDTEADGGADTRGADGAVVTAISGAAAGTVGGTTAGTYGVLTLNADGSYSYVRNAGTPGGVTDVFSYTITDSDGDTATATLTISIEDARPMTGENATVLVDDDALSGGNPDGTGDDVNAANLTGTLAASGGDGPLTWSLASSGAPVGFTYVANGTGIDVVQGTTVVLRVTLNAATGAYTVTQLAPIQHAVGSDENNQAFTLSYTVSDQDSDTANGTLTIDVDDDTPVAANDSNALLAGATGPATGNVLTNDSDGADATGTVTAITGFGGPGSVGGSTSGEHGTLTLNADGSYSYVRTGTGPISASDVFTYTLTDADGDTVTATLTITLADAAPETGENVTALLDDDALSGGNPNGTGDDVDAVNVTGTLSGSGGDGALTWAFQLSGAPAGFTYAAGPGGSVLVQQGATTVLTITLNSATGAYTVTQNAPIQHLAGSDENNRDFTLNYTVTDADGDSAAGLLFVNVDDDTPTATNDFDTIIGGSALPATGNVITDIEGDGGADSVGADGGAAIVAVTGFGGPGAVGGTTNGQYGVLTINADGSYSYVRNSGTPGNVEDIFTYTLTDSDGDTVTATLTIGIEDARPIVGENATVLLDDDALAGGNPDGTGDDVDAANLTGTLSGSGGDGALTWAYTLAGAPAGFTYVSGPGGSVLVQQGGNTVLTITLNSATGAYTVTQNAPIQHAAGNDENNQSFTLNYTVSDVDGDSTPGTLTINVDDDTPVVAVDGEAPSLVVDETNFTTNDTENLSGLFTTPPQYGADGAGTVAYALGVVAGPSGLVDTLTGQAVVLSLTVGGVVEGRTTGGLLVFTVAVDASGNVTLDQSRAVVHTPNGGPNDVATLAGNLVTLTQTVTDRDGDSASATANIGGMLRFVDDAPSAGANSAVQLDDDSLGGNAGGTGDVNPNTDNTSGTLSHSFGNDGGTIAFQTGGAPAGYRYTPSGSNILIQQEQGAGNWVTVVTVTLNPANGAYTVTQNAPVLHPAGADENDVSFTLGYVVTDGDLDTATSSIVINIDDDTPVAVAGAQSGIVDEDGLANGLTAAATGDVAGADVTATGFVTGLFSAGADTPLTYQLTGSTAGLPALFSGGVAVTYALAGNVLTASAGVNPVFTLTLNAATGQWDFVLIRPLDHANGGDENDIVLQFGGLLQATDADGDTVAATGTLSVTVDDDSPLVTNPAAAGGVAVDESNANPDGFPVSAASAASIISATLAYGADGSAVSGTPAYAISLTAGGATTLVTAQGDFPITLVQLNPTTIAGQYSNGGTQTAFTIVVDPATGIATLTQNVALEHNTDGIPGPAHNDVLTLAGLITATVTITDRDGDSHSGSAQVGGNISFFDDGPAAVADTDTVTEGAIVTGNVLTDDNFGADGAAPTVPAGGVVGVAAGSNTATPVFTGVGTVINTALGSLTLNADGSYSYDALPNTTAVVATDTFIYTIRDADGDTSTVTLTITINPVTLVADNDLVVVDEAALNANGSNPGSTAETAGGALAVAGAVSYTLPGGGVGTYGTLTLNANGSYSYTLTAPYDTAPDTNNGTNTELGRDVFTYTATDANGNTVTGTIAVDIIDDVPTARDDAAGLTEGGPSFVTFDVDTNDTPGADGTGSRTFTTLTGSYGNLTLNGDGTQTYTLTPAGQIAIDALAPGVTLQDVFTYTLTDGDGDTDPATLTITLTGADDPVLISNLTPAASGGDAVVDEDDLPAGSDTTPESLTATGNFTITAPDGVDDLTVGGVAVIVNGVYQSPAPVVTPLGNILTFTGYNPATGVVSYSYTLGAAETHANAGGENNLFENFAVTLTDVDGDNAGDTLSIRIVDDVPTANDDSGTQATENAPITVNVIANDVRGADGVSLTTGVAVVGGSLTGTGSLVYNNDGTFTYTPGAGEQGVVTFQYRITDADGDSDPATVTINLLADSTPAPVNIVAAVDDDGLPGNNPLSTTGDINADTGDSAAGIGNEAVFVGQINVNFGGDTGTVSFANLNGTFVQVGTERVALSWSGTTLTGTVAAFAADLTTPQARSGTQLFTIGLTASGTYTVTLLDNVLHAAGGVEANAPVVNLNYLATDSDGDSSTAGVLAITFNDDAPTAVSPTAISLINQAGAPVLAALDPNLLDNYGADGGTPRFAPTLDGTNSGLTSGLTPIIYDVSPDGLTLTGLAGATTVFTITLLPGTNQYQVDMDGQVDSLTTLTFASGAYQFVGGNTSWVGFVPIGQNTTGGAVNDNSRDLLVTPQIGGVNSGTINGSSVALGVGSGNAVDAGDMIRLDFVVDLVGDTAGPGGYGTAGNRDHAFDSHYVTNGASALITATGGSVVKFTAKDDPDGNNVVGDGVIDAITRIVIAFNGVASSFIIPTTTPTNYTVNGVTYTVTLNADGSVSIGGVQGTSGAGAIGTQVAIYTANGYSSLEIAHAGGADFKLGNFGAVIQNTNPVNFTVPVEVIDGDGDVSTPANLAITLNAPAAQAGWTPEKPGLLAAEYEQSGADTSRLTSSGSAAPQQIQLREQVQSNSLVAASLVALAGADAQLQEAGIGILRDDHLTRETGTDMSVTGPSVDRPLADNAIEAPKAVEALAIETAEPIQIDNLTVSQLWESTGLAPQELPVEQYAPAEHGSWVQLPNSGASMLTLPTDTGLIDALLLVRGGPVEAIEPQLADLQSVIADSVNDNGIDHLLDQLTGPEGNVPMLHMGDDIASALIDMPVSSDAMTHFSSISVSDQLQEMATSQT